MDKYLIVVLFHLTKDRFVFTVQSIMLLMVMLDSQKC